MQPEERAHRNFIEEIVEQDLRDGRNQGRVHTRFPPEPNGYLHIGHAKALCIDFGIAARYGGKCNLRFDDTNPTKEDTEYVDAIKRDIRWLGFEWDKLYYASDFFEELCKYAEKLIEEGHAYVDDLSADEMRSYRGTLTTPGKNSPYRDRAPEENLDLFRRMRAGEFPDGARVLRAKIDMASPNLNMRDPTLYRILRHTHHRTGDAWCIYPMYDFQHPLQDAIEGITHSLCSLEYEAHRPLYDWVVEKTGFADRPRQIEFARLNITRTVMSKRHLRRLVEERVVSGWDDPRMPTLVAMRRRGYPAGAIKRFLEAVGVAKADSQVEEGLLAFYVREALSDTAPRAMAVLRPVKVVITNWPEDTVETIEMENHPDHPEMGTRTVSFGRELYIEEEDFMKDPPPKYFRLTPGKEVRLKGAYIIRCEDVVEDAEGNVVEIRCTADLASKSGSEGGARKVKGTLHWIGAKDARLIKVRLFEPLLRDDAQEEAAEQPEDVLGGEEAAEQGDFMTQLNPNSLTVLTGCLAEPVIAGCQPGDAFQFLRTGYFTRDVEVDAGVPVFNRTVPLKDSWAKAQNKK